MTSDASPNGLALVIGSGGGIGAAMLAQLGGDSSFAQAVGLSRCTEVSIDYVDESSIAKAAQSIAELCTTSNLQLRLLLVATGFLHGEQGQPERSFANLDAGYLDRKSVV